MKPALAAALAALAAFFGLGAARGAIAPAPAVPAPLPDDPAAPAPAASAPGAAEPPAPSASWLDVLQGTPGPSTGFTSPDIEAANVRAFGQAVAEAEGTAKGPNGGYDVLFGWPGKGRTFNAAAASDHPRIRFFEQADEFIANGRKDYTTAAGRYQETATTYDAIRRRYGIPPGFTPELQDLHFEALLKDCGALPHVKAGRIPQAIDKARRTWASLPGADTPQPQRSAAYVIASFQRAGGTLA